MSTTMNFDLSPTLLSSLTQGGSGNNVYAYAIAFGASTPGGEVGLITSATLINNGVVSASSITLPSPNFYSGAVYVLIQQGGDGTLLSSIQDIGDISPANAATNNYSYQLFEATLSGSSFDQGDISSVNTFGFTSTYEVVFADSSTDQRGFRASGESIFNAVGSATKPFDPNQFPDDGRLATGPATASNPNPWPSADWTAYVNAFKTNTAVLNDIRIVAGFTQSPLQNEPMLSEYRVQYVAPDVNDKYGGDYFWLVPDTSNGATNTDWIRIPASVLLENIYTQVGPLEVHPGSKDADPVIYNDSFTPNNADGQVAAYFVTGFDAGFWGGSGTSPNPLDTTLIDFNRTTNWTVQYAYNAALDPSAVTYTNVLGTGAGTSGGNDRFYDPWAAQFLANSNSYGYSYSDLVSAGGVNPQITLWDPGANENVSTINIKLYDNSETPSSGYLQTPSIYVAPPSGGYHSALTSTNNVLGFDFGFSLVNLNFAPNENTPAEFRFYAPDSPQADANGFVKLNVIGSDGNWYIYFIENDSGTWSLSDQGGYSGQDGIFHIGNVPVTSDGSVSWYQLVFGGAGEQTVYNIYATSDPTTHVFTDVIADHAVSVLDASPTYVSINMAPGGVMTYDIATFGPPPTSAGTTGVTIHGSKQADFVNALRSAVDQLLPTSADDIIFGDDGDDQLSGLGGNDTLDGGVGVDFLHGGDGDDILQVRNSQGIHDMFDGGAGIDTLQLLFTDSTRLAGFNATASSIEILQGNDRFLDGTDDSDVFDFSGLTALFNLPYVNGRGGNDTLIGSDFADDLRGGDGDDILEGRNGSDKLNGGKGEDILRGGDGDDILQVLGDEGIHDTFDGGAGVDTLQFLATSSVRLAGFNATASSIEILQGNDRFLDGTDDSDVFDFSGLTALFNFPYVNGRGGDDTLIGSDFADDLRGGDGNDILDGRGGDDILRGGTGQNTVIFADGYGSDTVMDYAPGRYIFDLTGVAGVHAFSDLVLTEVTSRVVRIDFDGIVGGDTLTIQGTTILLLTANQGDFLFA